MAADRIVNITSRGAKKLMGIMLPRAGVAAATRSRVRKLGLGAMACLVASCASSDTRSLPLRVPLHAHPPSGFPSPQGIYSILNEPFEHLLRCYESSPRHGVTAIWFAIQPDGSVSDVELRSSTGDAEVDRCLVALVASKRFPEPDAITPVDVHAEFRRESGVTMAWPRSYSLCR